MPEFRSLPLIAEQKFTEYLSGSYSGVYTVHRAFSTEEYREPFILVKAGRFREIEPQSHVFTGSLIIQVRTQIDDANGDPVTVHDLTVADVYTLFADTDAIFNSVNPAGGHFFLHGMHMENYDMETLERTLVTEIEFVIHCQTATPSI